jgi:hypothetical protein
MIRRETTQAFCVNRDGTRSHRARARTLARKAQRRVKREGLYVGAAIRHA